MPGPAAATVKPLDVGTGRACASFGTDADWLSIGTVHLGHGFVELNGLPAFDEAWRGDAVATRRYRGWMTEDRFAFLRVEAVDGRARVVERRDASDVRRPRWLGSLAGVGFSVEADAAPDGSWIVQRWRLAEPMALRCRFAGRLDRPALAEITEINPPSPTRAVTELHAAGSRLEVRAPALPATAVVEASAGEWQLDGRGGALLTTGALTVLELRCAITGGDARHLGEPEPLSRTAPRRPVDPLVGRALAYVRDCTALTVTGDERVIFTDHRLLPLSWTRDAYYQALLLLAAGETSAVADHLRWLWRRCERPDGRWVRSHHADGRRKDLAFQADQQLYPILELADFWRATAALPEGVEWTAAVREAWAAALGEVDPRTGLMASDENAADDPVAAPFIAGSQILLWYAAQRLAELAAAGALELDAAGFAALAERVEGAFRGAFPHEGRWSYATDGGAGRIDYHDANDLPFALAPLWGFCAADDPAWRQTMEFAFSTANPGYFDGERAGLGSAHTPGPWTLGDIQAWLLARQTGDPDAANRALERLAEVAFEDGMLPEAYSATRDPDLRIRHWFAWPGAALAAFLLLDAQGLLESRLRVPDPI